MLLDAPSSGLALGGTGPSLALRREEQPWWEEAGQLDGMPLSHVLTEAFFPCNPCRSVVSQQKKREAVIQDQQRAKEAPPGPWRWWVISTPPTRRKALFKANFFI
eukprot:1162064-Pelagomonas_calceolata.AAC.8